MDPCLLLKNMDQEVRAIDPGVGIAASGTLEASPQEFIWTISSQALRGCENRVSFNRVASH